MASDSKDELLKISGEEKDHGDDEDEDVDEDDDDDVLCSEPTTVKIEAFCLKRKSQEKVERESKRLATSVPRLQHLHSDAPSTSGLSTSDVDCDDLETDGDGIVIEKAYINVHHTYGDVTVHGARNLTIGGTQNIAKPRPPTQVPEKTLTWTEKIHNRTLSRMTSWTTGMVKTSALEKVMMKLNQNVNWVTIKGSPGEGKTTIAYMALEELKTAGRQVFHVISPEEFAEVTMTCTNPVIMLDDVLGNLEFDRAEWLRWKPLLHQVLDVTEHRSHQTSENKGTDGTVFILVGRDYVLNTASFDMGRIVDFFTRDEHVVNMSHREERKLQEKLAIWMAISESSAVTLDKVSVDDICRINVPHGFPHVCRLFVTMRKADATLDAKCFFRNPLEFLNQTVQKFMQNKLKLRLFKEMVKKDGAVSKRDLECIDDCFEIIEIADGLVGTYLRKEDDFFKFDHPSIYDSVAFNLCKRYPLFVIENCSLTFIHERLRIPVATDSQKDTVRNISGYVVQISRSYTDDLAKRFAVAISDGKLVQVLSHTALTDELFIGKMISHLTLALVELIHCNDKDTDEEFLSLIASNKSRRLLVYLENQKELQLNQSDINTVLYGVCKYAASDVLTYLTETRPFLDINIRYGEKQLTPLMIAAETRDSQFVQQIMALNPDLEAKGATVGCESVLHYVCENGLVDAIEQVLDKGTEIDLLDKLGRSPLFLACNTSQADAVRLLLKRGATIDEKSVVVSCERGNLDVVEMLFEKGATVNMVCGGYTPLDLACQEGDAKLMAFLLSKGASVNTADANGRHPLHNACYRKNPRAVQCLIEHGADIDGRNNSGETPLDEAAVRGSKECIQVLLNAGADVNVQREDGYTPLHEAAGRGYKECAQLLVEAGTNVNAQTTDGYTPLHTASRRGSKECVGMLLGAGANLNTRNMIGFTSLHTATDRRSKDCVNVLLKAGANVNIQSITGDTPLHKAAERGSQDCVDLIVKAGADVNVRSVSGDTPLHRAAERGSKECVDLLVKSGPDVNVRSVNGDTPLHKAAERGSKDCVDLLVKAEADVNVRSLSGDTPLHKAADSGSGECVLILLKAGTNLDFKCKNGYTPLQRARERGHKDCVDILQKYFT